jgi:hypothetical protein
MSVAQLNPKGTYSAAGIAVVQGSSLGGPHFISLCIRKSKTATNNLNKFSLFEMSEKQDSNAKMTDRVCGEKLIDHGRLLR